MNTSKADLRKAAAARRVEAHKTVDPSAATTALHDSLEATTGPISFYWPIRTEIDPRPVMEALAPSREVCLPVTNRDAPLSFRRWRSSAEMVPGGFGVEIPHDDVQVVPQVLVVPLLAFDARCHRLGYGAGHYDRTLEGLRAGGPVTAIGFAYEAQREDQPLPIEPTDQPLDIIITEARIHRPV